MRIMSCSDLHGDRSLAETLAAKAAREGVELVLLCGDLSFFDAEPRGLIKPFVERGQRVLFVPGNHDSFATAAVLAHTYKIKNLHGYSVRYEDIGIFGCGKATVGFEALSDDEIFDVLREAHEHVSYLGKKIMVTHVHPSGSTAERFTTHFQGSAGVRRAIEELQPDIAFCGHVHEAEGLEERLGKTRVINVGRRGFILDL